MTPSKKIEYDEQTIRALISAIRNEGDGYNWLFENHHRELVALCDMLLISKPEAVTWLEDFKFFHILNFYTALQYHLRAVKDDSAFNALMENNYKDWAATADAFLGSESAYQWLLDNGYMHFAALSNCLRETMTVRFHKYNMGDRRRRMEPW